MRIDGLWLLEGLTLSAKSPAESGCARLARRVGTAPIALVKGVKLKRKPARARARVRMFLILGDAKAFCGRQLDACSRLSADGQSMPRTCDTRAAWGIRISRMQKRIRSRSPNYELQGWGDQMRGFSGGFLHSRRFAYSSLLRALLAVLIAASATQAAAQNPDQIAAEAGDEKNNGTDPARPAAPALVWQAHFDLRGGTNTDMLSIDYTQPPGSATTRRAAVQNPDQTSAGAGAGEDENNGTDPTRPTASALVSYEHFDLRGGFNTDTLSIEYAQPLSSATTLRVKVPLVSNDVFGDSSVGVGDIGVRLGHVVTRTPQYGVVVNAELVFDTADGIGRGTGQNVLKTGLVYARFLKDGHIFAPAVIHSLSLWGEDGRADVNSTTIDFYFVPRLSNRDYYMTIDPAVVFNWEGDKQYGALAVTMGRRLGPMMGGRGQIYFKPSINFGAERPGNWGVMVGFQLIGF